MLEQRYDTLMSKTEILAELPRLAAEDRTVLLQRLCELQEQDLLNGIGPSAKEKEILEAAWADYQKDRNPGTPWRETLRRIRAARFS
jgi:hypothetical protein